MAGNKAIDAAGVVGAGTMGAGIAITIARAGTNTRLFDLSEQALDRSKKLINNFFEQSAVRKKLSPDEARAATARITYTNKYEDLGDCDLVVEAVYEDIAVKRELFAQLNTVLASHAVLLTNTSTLSITELASAFKTPEMVVGSHYCLPAQVMKLVEMSRGIQTGDHAWNIAWDFMRSTGQHPVETKDRPGFVLNYVCIPYHNDVIRLIEAGVAKPEDIDKAMKAAMSFAMGPCELIDLIGLDTQLRASEAFYAVSHNPRTAPPPLLQRMVAANLLGRKTKRGFYDYGRDALFGG